MPAVNCASPPNMAANGASARPDSGVPHQPAMFDATMNVAPAKPNRPSTDGAAIGWRMTLVATPSRAMSSSVWRRLSLIVLDIRSSLRGVDSRVLDTRYISYYEVF